MALLVWGILSLGGAKDMKAVWEIGFGTADSRTLISFYQISRRGSIGIISAILIANSPQPIISAAYFIYNSQFTAMAMASEWDSYSFQRKGLRISSGPTGAQRGSHLLQLPYRFAVPLMVLSGLLHWAASQSIFLVDVEVSSHEQGFITTCGYSPLAILCFVCLGVLMVLFLLALSFRRFKTGMPVAGNCSAAISAACHLPPSVAVPGTSQMPLQWGEVLVYHDVCIQGGHDGGRKGATMYPVRRCAFSHEAVSTPVPGVTYS